MYDLCTFVYKGVSSLETECVFAVSGTKLRVKLSHDQNRDNTEFYLHCKFQSLPFCVRRRNDVTDRKIAPKVQMPR